MNKEIIFGILLIALGGASGSYFINLGRSKLSLNSEERIKANSNENNEKTLNEISNLDSKFDDLSRRQEAFEIYVKNSINPQLQEILSQNGYTIKQLEKIADQAIQDSQDDFEIGNAYFVRANYDKALEYFRKSINRAPANIPTTVYFNIAQAKLKILEGKGLNYLSNGSNTNITNEEFNEIINDFSLAIEQNGNDFRSYNNRGIIYLELKQLEKSKFDFEKAIELNPNDPLGYINLSNIYLQKRDDDFLRPALELLNEAIKIDPSNAHAHYNRANLYESYLGEFNNAVNDYNNALILGFTNKHIYLNMGTTYGRWFEQSKEQERLNLAEMYYKKSLEIDEKFEDALQGLKNIEILKNRID